MSVKVIGATVTAMLLKVQRHNVSTPVAQAEILVFFFFLFLFFDFSAVVMRLSSENGSMTGLLGVNLTITISVSVNWFLN